MTAAYATPKRRNYDVVIVGGAIMGASTAWFLTQDPDFDGTVLVVERDPGYEFSATARSNSSIRQQFSNELNVRISQFGADFVENLPRYMGNDPRVPELRINNFGYLYLAASEAGAQALRESWQVQKQAGAATRLLSADEIRANWPFYVVDDILLGSINTVREGYFDGITVFDWFRKQSREKGVEYLTNEVVAVSLNVAQTRVDSVTLASGEIIGCNQVVNASGTRGAVTARMVGIDIPIEPRKRYTWVFTAEQPLDRPLPLTIDPSGVHVRQDGATTYLAGGHADHDPAVDFDDFTMDQALWQDHVWPALAARIPAFEAIRVQHEWAGHYDFNTLDQNAIVGPHDRVENFMFLNGFSGHGLQQAPAMGRGTAEWLVHGAFRTLDLSPLGYGRIARGEPYIEKAII